MRIDRDEAIRRLQSPNNLANRPDCNSASVNAPVAPSGSVVPPERPAPNVKSVARPSSVNLGRGAEVPEGQRDLIARAALLGLATQKQIGAHFGVAQKTVSQYEHGIVTPGKDGEERRAAHGKRVEEIRDLALTKTMIALGLMDDAKLTNLEVKDLGKFAKDMAGVYNSLAPKSDSDNKAPIQLIVYTPEVKSEDRYKIVDV